MLRRKFSLFSTFTFIFALFILSSTVFAQRNAPTVTITPDDAPNVFCGTLASWFPWVDNVVSNTQGTGGPASFDSENVFGPGSFTVTGFRSWQGYANPGDVFGPEYANECGNRMHWVVRVTAPAGDTISLADGVTINVESNEFVDFFTAGNNGITRTYNDYTTSFGYAFVYTVDYGADGIKNTADDVIATNGDPTAEVNEIVTLSPGLAFATSPADTEQDRINGTYDFLADLGVVQLRASASFGDGRSVRSQIILNGNANGNGISGVVPQTSPAQP